MRVAAETKKATRAKILEVERKLFAQQGFEASTTRDIARAANIAAGTLFNYFPTKEAIVECLVNDACAAAEEQFAAARDEAPGEGQSLEEELFAHVAALLRKLKPYRKYLPAVLETSLSPLAGDRVGGGDHLETVGRIVLRHGLQDAATAVALQLYWTLYTGVLAYWAHDSSPRQEDTLALADESMAMFVGWLRGQQSPNFERKDG